MAAANKYHEFLSRYYFPNAWKSYLILICGVLLTLAATVYTKNDIEVQTKHEFGLVCNEIKTKISTRLISHALLLRSGASFFTASDSVARSDWHFFHRNQKLEKDLPGIQGLGFSMIVPKNYLDSHTERIRKDGYPDYSIRPAGEREVYTSIVFIEPFTGRNLRAFGFDMYSEPVRRKAMQQARDMDIATLSGKVVLVQETDKDMQAGTLMYVPVFKKGMPTGTVSERRRAIIGWVYSPYRMHDLMDGILGRWDLNDDNKIRLQVYDDENISPVTLLYDSQSNDSLLTDHSAIQSESLPIEFNGKKWTLRFSHSNEQFSYKQSKVLIVFICGIIISILLFSLSLSLFNTRLRAQQIAKQLTDELKESERQFYMFMDYLPAIVFLKDSEGKTLFVNKYMDTVIGASQWLGKNMEEVFPNEFGVKLLADDLRVLKLGYDKIEESIILNDGMMHYFETQKFTIPRVGQGAYLGGISLDITERIRAEQSLKLKQFVIDNAGDTIMWISPEARVIDVNAAACRMLGYTRQELLQRSIPDIDPNYSADVWPGHFAELRQKSSLTFETQQRANNGRLIPVEVTANYIKFDNKEMNCAFIRDITDRKMAESMLTERNHEVQTMNERLVELNADKDRFISILAHDLKSPFTSILGFLNLLSENIRTYDIDTIERHINTVKAASQNTYKLLENILVWTRSQTGRIPYEPTELNIEMICNDVIAKLSMTAERKGITVKHHIDSRAIIVADENMIHTILLNLVSNAIKFTHEGGRIDISSAFDEQHATIAVSDTGIGIRPDIKKKLFDLTQIVTTEGTDNETGTGLGLLLCKDFVRKHGGTIWVESEYGKGSEFKFTLPMDS